MRIEVIIKTLMQILIITEVIMNKHIWTREAVEEGLQRNDQWVIRALLALYERQTNEEQATATTRYKNHRGFSAADARKLTGFTQFYLRRKFLSPKQMEVARLRLRKYAPQLAAIANEKQQVTA